MTIKNQTPIKRLLKAGIAITIEIGCEFVFVERGEGLTVIAGNNRMGGRKAGDDMRFDSPVTSITLESEREQLVELVVGFGEFRRLIVQGELSVSESIKTTSLNTNSLPISIKKRVGFIDNKHRKYVGLEKIQETEPIDFLEEGRFYCVFENDSYLYAINRKKINIYNSDMGLFESVAIKGVIIEGDIIAAAFYRGSIYCILGESRNKKIYKISTLTGDASVFCDISEFMSENGFSVGHGGFFYDKRFVFKAVVGGGSRYVGVAGNGSIVKFNVGDDLNIPDIRSHDARQGRVFLRSVGWFDETFSFVGSGNMIGLSGGIGMLAVSTALNRVFVAELDRIVSYVYESVEYSAMLYMQDGDDVSTRYEFPIIGEFDFFKRGAGVVMAGPIVSALLRGISGNYGVDANYLDYVVSVTYSDGFNLFKKSAGTATWAYRGLQDDGQLLLESDFEIEVMPEFVTNVY